MSIIVQKYGGSSVADLDKIKKIAEGIAAVKKAGFDIAVVVSAMGKTTNSLIEMAQSISPSPAKREMDMLLSTGERITMSLLCIALNELDIEAISLTGSQSGIITNDRHNDARVIEVRPVRVQDELEKGKVVVIGGFQGVSYKRDITTLGRGGSDTSAVALAAALNAERCEIYSDVDGVYTADPSLIKEAKHLKEISYQQMQEISISGAKVLNAQAVQFAKEAQIAIYTRSTFNPGKETIVRNLAPGVPKGVKSVVYEKDIVRIIINNPENEGSFEWLINYLDENEIKIKELNYAENETQNAASKFSFVISYKEVYGWDKIKSELVNKFGKSIELDFNLSTLSLIGEGLNIDNKVLSSSIKLFNQNNIKVYGVSTTSFRISILVQKEYLEKSLLLCHKKWIEESEEFISTKQNTVQP